jgi:death-on-curing protein
VRYLTAGEVMLVNRQEVGPDLLADFGLLEAAVLRPQQSVFGADAYPDIHAKAAAMIALPYPQSRLHRRQQAHRCVGYGPLLQPQRVPDRCRAGRCHCLAVDIAEGQIDVEGIAGTLKGWAKPLRLPEE